MLGFTAQVKGGGMSVLSEALEYLGLAAGWKVPEGRDGARWRGRGERPLVSADIVGDPRAAVINLDLTHVVDATLVKVMAWYDNEWGFAHQLIREARSTLGLAAT